MGNKEELQKLEDKIAAGEKLTGSEEIKYQTLKKKSRNPNKVFMGDPEDPDININNDKQSNINNNIDNDDDFESKYDGDDDKEKKRVPVGFYLDADIAAVLRGKKKEKGHGYNSDLANHLFKKYFKQKGWL